MLTILEKCSHFCLLICLCGKGEYPVSFPNKLVSSSFKWVSKYILFRPKLKGEGRSFWNGEMHILISGGGSNVNYYKTVHHLIPTQGNREHPGNFQNKSVSSPFNWVSRYNLFLPKLKGRGSLFFCSSTLEGGLHYEITPKSTWLSQDMKKSLLFWNLK